MNKQNTHNSGEEMASLHFQVKISIFLNSESPGYKLSRHQFMAGSIFDCKDWKLKLTLR